MLRVIRQGLRANVRERSNHGTTLSGWHVGARRSILQRQTVGCDMATSRTQPHMARRNRNEPKRCVRSCCKDSGIVFACLWPVVSTLRHSSGRRHFPNWIPYCELLPECLGRAIGRYLFPQRCTTTYEILLSWGEQKERGQWHP